MRELGYLFERVGDADEVHGQWLLVSDFVIKGERAIVAVAHLCEMRPCPIGSVRWRGISEVERAPFAIINAGHASRAVGGEGEGVAVAVFDPFQHADGVIAALGFIESENDLRERIEQVVARIALAQLVCRLFTFNLPPFGSAQGRLAVNFLEVEQVAAAKKRSRVKIHSFV